MQNKNRDLNKVVGEQPITDGDGLGKTDLLWKIHYKNIDDNHIGWIHAYCKTQEEAEELFLEDVNNWYGTSKYEFLYAEVIGEVIFNKTMQAILTN